MEPLRRPSDKSTTVEIRSGRNEVIIKLNCFLHTTDSEALLDKIFDIIKDLPITEKFIDKMIEEQNGN